MQSLSFSRRPGTEYQHGGPVNLQALLLEALQLDTEVLSCRKQLYQQKEQKEKYAIWSYFYIMHYIFT